MPINSPDLFHLAGRVAEQLVATALEAMIAGPGARIVVTIQPAELQAAPPTERRALPPAPAATRGGKSHRSTGRPRGRPRKDGAPARRTRNAAGSSAAASTDPLLGSRRCRKCHRQGTIHRVSGSDRTVKCSACGCTWEIRLKASEREPAAESVIAKARPVRAPATNRDECRRCDHSKSAHVGEGTKCLVPRCVCSGWYE